MLSTPDLVTPERATRSFCEAVNRGDLSSACNCFTREGCLITPDATAMRGREAISGVLAQLIDAGARLSIRSAAALRAGGVVLSHGEWVIESNGPEEDSFVRDARPTVVLQLIEEQWKLAIAAPWGWGA